MENSPRLPAVVLVDGAGVRTVVTVASDVDDAAAKEDCRGDTWLAMSCRIHSCCSDVNPMVSDTGETVIASSYFADSASGETMARDTEKIVPKHVATAAGVDCYKLQVCMCLLF